MVIVPNQYFGIGDVIFCQTLVRRVADGRQIVWPVMGHFVEGLNRAYPDILFIDYKTAGFDHELKTQFEGTHHKFGKYTQLPLRWADSILKVHYDDCMKAKYRLYGMDYNEWRYCSMWNRDKLAEWELATSVKVSGLYTFGNSTFGSDCRHNVVIPDCDVYLSVKEGFSLFDWAGVICNATSIHTVNTSIIYLLEMLDLKAKEVHLYQRSVKGQTFDNIKYILKQHKYIFHAT